MIRVAHIVSGDLWAGAEVMAFELIREFVKDAELEVLVILMNPGKLARELDSLHAAAIVIDETKLGNLGALRGVLQAVRRFKPQIVHTHRRKENVLGALAAKAVGAVTLRTEHGWVEFAQLGMRLDKRAYAWLDWVAGRYLQDAIVAVSEELAGKLRARFLPGSITVIENGINVESVRRAAENAAEIRIDRTKHAIGIVGRLVPVKRHDRFIAAAKLLVAASDAYEFHIIGDGPLRDVLAREVVAARLQRTVYLHGFCDNVAAVIAGLSAVVICSDHEGVPMNALEAAALNVPLVVAPLPSLVQIVRSGATGLVCHDHSPASLAAAIEHSVKLKQPRQPLPADWPYRNRAMAARYKRLYLGLIGDPVRA